MPSRIVNEGEHRRGLVLGLTLAEVLILLLFLILLALGARLVKAESKHPGNGTHVSSRADLQARIRELEVTIYNLSVENARLRADSVEKDQKLAAFEMLVAAARRVNPNDPPAVLKIAIEWLEAIGINMNQDHWKYLIELSSKLANSEATLTPDERDQFRRALLIFISSNGNSTPGHKWPPIIRLSEADGYFFDTGSAELRSDFAQRLVKNAIPEVLRIAGEFQVDVIEVVGHTDEQPIAPRPSSLDKELFPVLRREKGLSTLIPADNAGLGFIRALAVVETLRKDVSLSSFRILPLSGAQLIQTDGTLSKGMATSNVRERRRIEIRMRKSN